MNTSIGHLDAAASTHLLETATMLREGLGERLLGVYLHGSGALGGYLPAGGSDVDVLVVVDTPLDELSRRRMSSLLSRAAASCPAPGGFECSVVTIDAVANPSPAPTYEIHVNGARVVVAEERRVDHDLPSYFAVCRACGVAVFGPHAYEVFGEVDIKWVVQSWLTDLRWAEENAPAHYRVLNVCRIWRSLTEGGFWSKLDGASWAALQLDDASIVENAVAHHRGRPAPPISGLEASAFVDSVLKRVPFPG